MVLMHEVMGKESKHAMITKTEIELYSNVFLRRSRSGKGVCHSSIGVAVYYRP